MRRARQVQRLGALGLASRSLRRAPAPRAPSRPPSRATWRWAAPTARVTVIEYASVGCPHCADWNNDVFPAIKAKYIDTGKVRFVVREMLTGDGDAGRRRLHAGALRRAGEVLRR